MEPHVRGHRRQRQTPRRGELRAAVEGAVHPQEVQRLAERIGGGNGSIASIRQYARSSPIIQGWTFEHEPATSGHRQCGNGDASWTTCNRQPERSRHGLRRTDTREPRKRRADHVPPDRRDTDGELVAIDLELPAGRRVPGPLHIHPLQEERFEVVDGTMRFRMGRERIVAGPGEVVVVPAGVPHDFANAGDDRRARPRRGPARARDGAAVRDRGPLAEQGRTTARRPPAAARPRAVRARVRGRGAGGVPAALGAARSRSPRSPGSPGAAGGEQ